MKTLLGAAAAAVLVLTTACDSPVTGGEGAPVGTIVEGSGSAQGIAMSVSIPDGRLGFVVSEPSEDLPAYDETYDHAGDGASFVGVTWEYDFRDALPVTRTPGQPDVEPSVALVADGRSYSLDEQILSRYGDNASIAESAIDYFGTAWVAVEGEPEDLAISVEFDGLTQEVPVEFPDTTYDHGVAQALYGSAADVVRLRGECGSPTYAQGSRVTLPDAACRVTVSQVPYQREVGWVADRSSSWLVVEINTYPGAIAQWRGAGDDRASYDVDDLGTLAATYEGQQPEAVVFEDPDEGRVTLVFASDGSGTLQIDGTWASVDLVDADGAPSDPSITATWTVGVS